MSPLPRLAVPRTCATLRSRIPAGGRRKPRPDRRLAHPPPCSSCGWPTGLLSRANPAAAIGQHRHRTHRQELRLPVLQGAGPEVGVHRYGPQPERVLQALEAGLVERRPPGDALNQPEAGRWTPSRAPGTRSRRRCATRRPWPSAGGRSGVEYSPTFGPLRTPSPPGPAPWTRASPSARATPSHGGRGGTGVLALPVLRDVHSEVGGREVLRSVRLPSPSATCSALSCFQPANGPPGRRGRAHRRRGHEHSRTNLRTTPLTRA